MADSYRGTTADQDVRFGNKDAKLKKSMTFPPEFSQRVDKRKIELSVFRPWIATKVTQLLGFEDEVVIEYAAGLLEDASTSVLDPKGMQINLTGFLESKAPEFMLALWKLLLSAQESPVGVPQEFIEQKKIEMQKKQEEQSMAVQRRNDEMADYNQSRQRMDEIRQRERGDRPSRGRGRGGFRPPPERDSGYGGRRGPAPSSAGRGPAPRRQSPSPQPTSRRDRSPSPDRERYSRKRRSPSPYERRRRRPSPDRRSPSPRPSRRSKRSPSPRRRSPSRSPPPARRGRSPSPNDRSASPPVGEQSRRRYDSRSPPPAKRRRGGDYDDDHDKMARSPSPDDRRRPSRRYRDEDRSRSPPSARSRRARYSDSPSPPPSTRRRDRSVTPKYGSDGRPRPRRGRDDSADIVRAAEEEGEERQQGLSIKGSAGQLQERMLREKAELARRSRD